MTDLPIHFDEEPAILPITPRTNLDASEGWTKYTGRGNFSPYGYKQKRRFAIEKERRAQCICTFEAPVAIEGFSQSTFRQPD
jgi:hypothetical protein